MSPQHPAAAPSVDATATPAAEPAPKEVARVESEWRQLRRAFAYHPFVDVVPLSGDPPVEYQVQYKVTTLAINEAGELAYVTACPVHVWLPPQFPHVAPVVRPMTTAFHPNVAMEWVHLNQPWYPEASLVDVVAQVGFLLAFQSYDANAVANPVAMNWVYTNPHLLPTDPAADFSPAAGGDPLARIMRFGGATLRELQEKLESAAERIVAGDAPPAPEELEALAAEAQSTVPLFTDADVPEHLRATAAELGELAASVKDPLSVWPRLARLMALSRSAAAAANSLVGAEEALRRVLAAEATRPGHGPAADPSARDDPANHPRGAAARVPAPEVIEPVAQALRRAVVGADQAIDALRDRLTQLGAAPRVASAAGDNSILSRRLGRELARLAEVSEPTRAAGAWLASLEPVLENARHEAAAADRVAAWAEHRDALWRGRELAGRLKATPSGHLQAYRIESAAGSAGPFEYEQRVDAGDGGGHIAVWNLRSRLVRVLDTETEEVIARGDGRDNARVVLSRGGPHGGAGGARSLVVGEHTEELRIQFDALMTQAVDALSRLRPHENAAPPPAAPFTWPARLAAELDEAEQQAHAEGEHRRAMEEWRSIAADLGALGRFKHRLATCHLLGRLIEFIPRAQSERERLRAAMTRADARLAEIGARSARDTETNQLIIPAQFAAEYARHLADRDAAQQRVQRLDLAIDGATERAKLRLAKPRLHGSAEPVELRVLGPLPAGYADLRQRVSDEAVQQLASQLEQLLGKPLSTRPLERLRPDATPAPAAAAAPLDAAPSAPAGTTPPAPPDAGAAAAPPPPPSP